MKKLFLLLLGLLCMGSLTAQDNYASYTSSQVINNKLSTPECFLSYIPSTNRVKIQVDASAQATTLFLTKTDRKKLADYLLKFREWRKIADSAQVSVNKIIGTLSCPATFIQGHMLYRSNNATFELKFESTDKYASSTKLQHLIISLFPINAADNNKKATSEVRVVMLEPKEVEKLYYAITDEGLEQLLKSSGKSGQKPVEALFN